MFKLANDKGYTLQECSTFTELPPTVAASGGTITTALYQLGKKREGKGEGTFDALLMTNKGDKSEFAMKNTSPKGTKEFAALKRSGGPWIMAPVMVYIYYRKWRMREAVEHVARLQRIARLTHTYIHANTHTYKQMHAYVCMYVHYLYRQIG